VDGHDPNDRDPEILEVIEALLDAAEVARGRERAWVELVDNGGFDPVRDRVRRGRFGEDGPQQRNAEDDNRKGADYSLQG
jgi:hypothetical protein